MVADPDEPTRPTTLPHLRPGWSDDPSLVPQQTSALREVQYNDEIKRAAALRDKAADASFQTAGNEQETVADQQPQVTTQENLSPNAPVAAGGNAGHQGEEAKVDDLNAFLAASREPQTPTQAHRNNYGELAEAHADAPPEPPGNGGKVDDLEAFLAAPQEPQTPAQAHRSNYSELTHAHAGAAPGPEGDRKDAKVDDLEAFLLASQEVTNHMEHRGR